MKNNNNKEYIKWKQNHKTKRAIAIASLAAVTASAGVGIGYAVWHNSQNKPTPTPPVIQDNITWGDYDASMEVPDRSQIITAFSSTGGSIEFAIVGEKPNEVSFNSTTGQLTYNNAVEQDKTITIKATSSNGATATININILVPDPNQDTITWNAHDNFMNVGDTQTITAISSTSNTITYSVAGTHPSAVTFNTTTGELSYNTAVIDDTSITIRASTNKTSAELPISILAPHWDVKKDDCSDWGDTVVAGTKIGIKYNDENFTFQLLSSGSNIQATNLTIPDYIYHNNEIYTINDEQPLYGSYLFWSGSVLSGTWTFPNTIKSLNGRFVTSMGNVSSLEQIKLPSNLISIRSMCFSSQGPTFTFSKELELPQTLTSIGLRAFETIKTNIIIGNYNDFPDVDNQAFTGLIAANSKGIVINYGDKSSGAFLTWLIDHGLKNDDQNYKWIANDDPN